MTSSRIDLKHFYAQFVLDEENSINLLKDSAYNTRKVLFGLISKNVNLMICEIYLNKDFKRARTRSYNAALIAHYLHKTHETGDYSSNVFLQHQNFCYAIISDNQKIINCYLSHKDETLNTFQAIVARSIMDVLKQDTLALNNHIAHLAEITNKSGWENKFVGLIDCFQGLLENNKALIEKGIESLLNLHGHQGQPAVVKDYLNIESLTIAKLANRKGIIVECNHILLPSEMIPGSEFEDASAYKFLDEN